MAEYTVRVELHSASEANYNRLHDAMEKAGFSRTITSGYGKQYRLPTAEYRYNSGSESIVQVTDKAKNIAALTRPNPWIQVTEGPAYWWLAEAA